MVSFEVSKYYENSKRERVLPRMSKSKKNKRITVHEFMFDSLFILFIGISFILAKYLKQINTCFSSLFTLKKHH